MKYVFIQLSFEINLNNDFGASFLPHSTIILIQPNINKAMPRDSKSMNKSQNDANLSLSSSYSIQSSQSHFEFEFEFV